MQLIIKVIVYSIIIPIRVIKWAFNQLTFFEEYFK